MADVDGGEVVDNPAASRFELTIDGRPPSSSTGWSRPCSSSCTPASPTRWRVKVSAAGWSGAAVEVAERDGLTIVPTCPFARAWLRRHPEEAARVSIAYPD